MSANTAASPSSIARNCYVLSLRRAARAVSRRYDNAFAPLDLNNGQFSILSLVAGLAPVGITALAERLEMDRTTLTAALKPLLRRGLIKVQVSPGDLRGRDATLTRAGHSLLTRAIPIWQRMQDELEQDLSPEHGTRLRTTLAELS
jgi:DNA-binding MarR family transcriptional regulator